MKMKRFFILLRLEIKRAMKAFPKFLLSAVLMFMVVLGIAMAAGKLLDTKKYSGETLENEDVKNENDEAAGGASDGTALDSGDDEDGKKVKVGVVTYDESKMMKLATSILKSSDSVTQNINLVFMDETVAEKKLAEKELLAVIVVRENTMHSILSGENIPVEVKFQENAGYEAAVFQVVVNAAVHYLASAQAGVYSVYDFYYEHYKGLYIEEALDRLNTRYISMVLGRNRFFENTTVVATGELDIMESYMITGLVFFFFMFGINCITYLEPYRKETVIALRQNGVPVFGQFMAKFAGLYIVYSILAALIMMVVYISGAVEKSLALRLFVGELIILTGVVLIVLIINMLVKNKLAAIMIMFLVAVLQEFLVGGMIPSSMLPYVVEDISRITPAYYMVDFLKKIYLGLV